MSLGPSVILSGYHMAELLRTKDEAPGAWKRMLLRIRTLGFTVNVVGIDNDSVFLGAEFRSVCDDFGVEVQQRTTPYRHHQLARIERHWRTISEAVTAPLFELAKGFWGYAFLSDVAYVRNRAVWHSDVFLFSASLAKVLKLLICPVFVCLAAMFLCTLSPLVERKWIPSPCKGYLWAMLLTLLPI